MTDETIRTFITALSAVLTTALTVWFAFRSIERKERITKLEKELKSAFEEFTLLYKVEESLLKELSGLKSHSIQQLKIDARKQITDQADSKITLTPDKIKTKIKDLDL
jgi:hypothetical protein